MKEYKLTNPDGVEYTAQFTDEDAKAAGLIEVKPDPKPTADKKEAPAPANKARTASSK